MEEVLENDENWLSDCVGSTITKSIHELWLYSLNNLFDQSPFYVDSFLENTKFSSVLFTNFINSTLKSVGWNDKRTCVERINKGIHTDTSVLRRK